MTLSQPWPVQLNRRHTPSESMPAVIDMSTAGEMCGSTAAWGTVAFWTCPAVSPGQGIAGVCNLQAAPSEMARGIEAEHGSKTTLSALKSKMSVQCALLEVTVWRTHVCCSLLVCLEVRRVRGRLERCLAVAQFWRPFITSDGSGRCCTRTSAAGPVHC
jgi:hypothetical protein